MRVYGFCDLDYRFGLLGTNVPFEGPKELASGSGRQEELEPSLTYFPRAEDMTAAANRVVAVRSVDGNPFPKGGCPKIVAGQIDP